MISVLQLSSQSVVEIIMLRGDPGRSVKGAPRAGVATAKEYFGHGHVWSDLRLILVGFVSGFVAKKMKIFTKINFLLRIIEMI